MKSLMKTVAVCAAMCGMLSAEASVAFADELPEGYASVEYIESTGTQWINTGIVPTENTRVVLDFQFAERPTSSAYCGCADNTGPKLFACGASDGKWALWVGQSWSSPSVFSFGTFDTGRHTFDIQNGDQRFDGETVNRSAFKNDPKTNFPFYLFAERELLGGKQKEVQYWQKIRVFSCTFYEDGEEIAKFIPCSDGFRGALYETHSKALFKNGGSGNFRVPKKGVHKTAYLESTGTQWINTGVLPTKTTRLVVQFSVTDESVSGWSGSADNNSYGWSFSPQNKTASWTLDWWLTGGGEWNDALAVHTVDIKRGLQLIDGIQMGDRLYEWTPQKDTLCLFALLERGVIKYPQSVRLHGCRIYDGDTLIRDFVPYENGTEGALYDRVSGTFYANGGTGSFRFPKRPGFALFVL